MHHKLLSNKHPRPAPYCIPTYVFDETVLLLQSLSESTLHGREEALRVECTQAAPVGEEGLALAPEGRGDVGSLQLGQEVLLHAPQGGHVLALRVHQPAPLHVQLTAKVQTGKH